MAGCTWNTAFHSQYVEVRWKLLTRWMFASACCISSLYSLAFGSAVTHRLLGLGTARKTRSYMATIFGFLPERGPLKHGERSYQLTTPCGVSCTPSQMSIQRADATSMSHETIIRSESR